MATITGTEGADLLSDTPENDVINGLGGDDNILVGSGGADLINGGAGADLVSVLPSASGQVRLTFTSAEVGNGNVNDGGAMANQDGGLAVRWQSEDAAGALTGPVTRVDDEGVTFLANTSGVTFDVRDLVSGVARGDQFTAVTLGTQAAEVLNASQAGRAYYINGGQGNDTENGGAGNDFLVGGAGDDELNGGAGADSFIAGAGTDVIRGGESNDTVIFNISTEGNDFVDLGAGTLDRVNVSAATGGQVRVTFTSAEAGNNNPNASGTMANQDIGLAVRLQLEGAGDTLTGTASRYDDEGIAFISTTPGLTFDVRDLVSGAARGDQFGQVYLGTGGNEQIGVSAGDPATYFNMGMGDDTAIGGNAADFLVGGAGADYLRGGAGADQFLAGAGNDNNAGEAGDDTISGGDGADALGGGEGNDSVLGEAGSDTLFGEDGADYLSGGADIDTLYGGAGGDNLSGGDGDDFVAGQAGDDFVGGGAGNDMVMGDEGNDYLFGEDGSDTLYGSIGSDTMIAGGGADTIRYDFVVDSAPGAADVILDFGRDDRIDLSRIDANAGVAGDQAFTLVTAFSNMAGQAVLTYSATAGTTTLTADVTGDGVADMTVIINGQVDGSFGFML